MFKVQLSTLTNCQSEFSSLSASHNSLTCDGGSSQCKRTFRQDIGDVSKQERKGRRGEGVKPISKEVRKGWEGRETNLYQD